MRTQKRKVSLGIKIASILACVAMLSVGFAAWMIVNIEQPEEIASGSFVAHTVEMRTVKFDMDVTKFDNANISFSAPTNKPTTTYRWLTYGDGENTENKTTTLQFKIYDEDSKALKDVVSKVTVTLTLPDAVKTAITKKLITSPTLVCGDQTATDTDGDGVIEMEILYVNESAGESTKTLTISFDWGETFGGKNPYEHYNNKAVTETLAQEAFNNLEALRGVNAAQMEISLVAVAK